MTPYELVERDLKKAKLNLSQALRRPNIPQAELQHLEDLVGLRQYIFDVVRERRDRCYGK